MGLENNTLACLEESGFSQLSIKHVVWGRYHMPRSRPALRETNSVTVYLLIVSVYFFGFRHGRFLNWGYPDTPKPSK